MHSYITTDKFVCVLTKEENLIWYFLFSSSSTNISLFHAPIVTEVFSKRTTFCTDFSFVSLHSNQGEESCYHLSSKRS